jgi:hypothetical protein
MNPIAFGEKKTDEFLPAGYAVLHLPLQADLNEFIHENL